MHSGSVVIFEKMQANIKNTESVIPSVCLALTEMRKFTAVGRRMSRAVVLYLLSSSIPTCFSLKITFLTHVAQEQATLP